MRKPAVIRLIIAAGLFLAWIGYLAYLALTASQPIVLSRPQFLVASSVVIAQVNAIDERVEVKEVLRTDQQALPKTLQVTNLADCRRPQRGDEDIKSIPPDFQKPGLYILPLIPGRNPDEFSVIPIPLPGATGPPRIYPVTDETRAQLKRVLP